MFQICSTTQLFSKSNSSYNGIAFDGYYYYLTSKYEKEIVKLDMNFKLIDTISTLTLYTAICYDTKERCFWAVASGSSSNLFKLDSSFKEIDKIKIDSFGKIFSAIAYCQSDDSILIYIYNRILHVDKSSNPNIEEIRNSNCKFIAGINCMTTCYLYHFTNKLKCFNITSKGGLTLESFTPPKDHIIEQALYLGHHDNYDHFQFLTTKQDSHPYIIEAKVKKDILDKLCNCKVLSHIEDCYHDDYGSALFEKYGCNSHSSCNDYSTCNDHSTCNERPHCNGCNDVLESIALIETALSHILNAEGEKIQKVIASTSCVSEILAVNKEVNRTILHVTNLEHVLYAKLDALRECSLRDCCKNHCSTCSRRLTCEDNCDDNPHYSSRK